MNELIEAIKASLDSAGELTEVVLNAISLIFIVTGVITSVIKSIKDRPKIIGPMHIYFRMLFGGWLVVALEFQLAADIVGTMVSPTYDHLIQLGAVAVIRTFLNYFLSKELNEELASSKKALSK